MCTLSHKQRCDDHTTLCETWTLLFRRCVVLFQERWECEQPGGRRWKESAEGWGCVTGLVPENLVPASSSWAAETPPERARHSLLAFPPLSLPHEPAKPYLASRMKKEKKTHALLFLLLLHFTLGRLFFTNLFSHLCLWLRLLALLLSG